MDKNIKIQEKPEWVSWEEIHKLLWESHASNRAHGICMRKPSLPGEEIKKEIGEEGVMIVALDDKKLIGTAALLKKHMHTWFGDGDYGYLCYASILPQYRGKNIYKDLCAKREELAKQRGLKELFMDTHHKNIHVINLLNKNGFIPVDIRIFHDHWNIVLFKWIDGCPYSYIRCRFEFVRRKMLLFSKYRVTKVLRKLHLA